MEARIDLNSDLGESFGSYRLGFDARMMDFVTSASVACGFHAGDPATMRHTVGLARDKNVSVGAHPGFRDLQGFGRRDMELSPEEVYDETLYQIGALDAFVRAGGMTLQHVKAHGALYNKAARDCPIARAMAAATCDYRRDLILVGPPSSELEKAAQQAGLRFAAEVFADRTYQRDGSLTRRGADNAFVRDPQQAAARVVSMVRDRRVQAVTGEWIPIRADTVCLHGDNPEAVRFIEKIHRALQEESIEISALCRWLV